MASASAESNSLGAEEVNEAAQPQQSSVGSVQGQATLPQSSDTAPTLDKVPDDVLLEIFTLLDDPRYLTLTSKRFHVVGKDHFFRARWFLNRFPPHQVIFEAIARPRLFDANLLERLTNGGAQLSRHLVQLLHLLHNDSRLTAQYETRWGSGISLNAYIAVLSKAEQLYGNVSFHSNDLDDYAFAQLLRDAEVLDRDVAPAVATLIKHARYMPLPLTFSKPRYTEGGVAITVKRADAQAVEAVLLKAPDLAPLMQSNGYQIDFQGSLWLCRKLFSSDASPENIASRLQKLQELNLLHMPRNVASNIILALRPNVAPDGFPASSASAVSNYEILLELDRTGGLEYDLEALVAAIASHFMQGSIDATLVPLLERLEQDFPRVELSAVFVRAMFVKAEYQKLTHLDAVAALMGRHKVTTEDVMQSCLRNTSNSTLPIQYAARFIEGFNMETFLTELIETLLNQPYRGKMLRELSLLTATLEGQGSPSATFDFRKMLADAVERKAFTHRDLPEQEWSRFGTYSHPRFNRVEPARSLLSRSWKQGNAQPFSLPDIRFENSPLKMKPTGLPGFTHFITPEQAKVKAEAREEQPHDTESNDEANDVDERDATNSLHSKNQDGNLGTVEFVRLQDVRDFAGATPWYDYILPDEACRLLSQRFQNFLGPILEDAEEVALVIVELLGADTKAADVCLAHSFLNGNLDLSEELLKRGVSLTFEHLKIAAKLGYDLPSSLLDHIKGGCPFKASFEASENEPDKDWRYRFGLTEDVRQKCRTFAESTSAIVAPILCFNIDVDDAGKLCIEAIDSPRKEAAEQIVTHSTTHSASVAGKVADDNCSELSDVPMEEAGDGGAAAVEQGDEVTPLEADTSIAQRIKRSSRKSRPTSFAESVKDESDSDTEIGAAAASTFIATIEGIPSMMSRDDLARRLHAAELWLQHLERMKRQHEDFATALSLSNIDGYTTHSRRYHSQADRELTAMLGPIKTLVQSYKAAKPAHRDEAVVAELKELYEELDAAETKADAEAIKALTSRKAKDQKIFKYARRQAFRQSPFSVRERPPSLWRPSALARWEQRKENMKPLSDEDSEDENFEASLSQSDSVYSSLSDSSARSESDAESESSDAEPAPKRAKTGRNTASAKLKGSSKKSAKSNGKRKATSTAARDKGRKRVRSQSSSEEESSSSDSDEEVAAVSTPQDGNSSKMQAMASGSGSGSGSNAGIASPTDDDAEPEESTHPVYNHHLFNDEEFQGILTAIRADGLDDAAAEALYLEELLDMELDDDSEEGAD